VGGAADKQLGIVLCCQEFVKLAHAGVSVDRAELPSYSLSVFGWKMTREVDSVNQSAGGFAVGES